MKLARLCWIEYSFFAHIDPKLFPKDAEQLFIRCGWKRIGVTSGKAPIYTSDSGTAVT